MKPRALSRHGNVSEYFRTLLREAEAREEEARLEALLIEGMTSGKDVPLTREFRRGLRREAAGLTATNKGQKRT